MRFRVGKWVIKRFGQLLFLRKIALFDN